MADYTFFFNPQSRAMIARWALHEAGADYEPVLVPWENKPQALLDANPMGKVPTIIHHASGGDLVVSEGAAICHYLAEMECSDLLPRGAEKAPYFRWLLFAAGPMEAGVTARSFGFDPGEDPQKQMTAGWGSFDRMVDTLDAWLSDHEHVCGERFTMADVYVGSQVAWGLQFGTLPERESFRAYADRVYARDAHREAEAIDVKLAGEMQRGG